VKVTREKAAEHRAAIVTAAGRLFRERGFEGVGVAEIMRAAGLTHGGFYGHFASKDALAAEACGQTLAESLKLLETRFSEFEGDFGRYFATYLSERHRDDRERGCPMAAHASEVVRQSGAVQAEFSAGLDRFIEALAGHLPAGHEPGERRHRAVAIVAALVGGLALARATAASAPELSAEILASVRTRLTDLADLEA
jgi:TetR/AcrR family transcriptional regulator, transcriptional repressor for nem operon